MTTGVTVLAELLAVIRREDEPRVVENAERAELVMKLAELRVDIKDRSIVGAFLPVAEDAVARGRYEGRVDVHEVEIQKERLFGLRPKPFDGLPHHSLAGHVLVVPVGVDIVVEALIEAELAIHPRVAVHAERSVPRFLQELRQQHEIVREHVVGPVYTVCIRIQRRQDRGHGCLGPARLADGVFEQHTLLRQLVYEGRRFPVVAVARNVVRPEVVYDDEDDVRRTVVAAPKRSRGE